MKEQTHKSMGDEQESSAFDAFYLLLPLAMVLAVSFGITLLPTVWIFGFFGLFLFVGLIVALTHHT